MTRRGRRRSTSGLIFLALVTSGLSTTGMIGLTASLAAAAAGDIATIAGSSAPGPSPANSISMIEPLRLSYEIACPADHAFEVWTQRFAAWWPPSHSTSGDPDTQVTLEPRLGGRIFERTAAGDEIDWGEVTVWDPPRQLAYLWHTKRDRAEATDVELTFVDKGDGTTRLEIVHDGWDRLGAEGQTWRDANTNGWEALIPHFIAAAAPPTAP